MAVKNPRDTRIRLEEEAMPGSTVEARQTAERAAVSKANKVPTAKELKQMPDKVRADVSNRVKAETLINIAMLSEAVDVEIQNAASDLDAILAEAAASTAMAEAAEAEAAAYAAEATAAEAEGDRLVVEGFEKGLPGFGYNQIGSTFQNVVNQQPKYTNAGVAAAIAALQAVGVEGLVDVMAQIRELYPDISSEDALMLLKFDKRFNEPYLTRFAGNRALMDAGFAPMDDKEYLATEKAFDKIFTSYDLKTFNNRERYAKLIGGRVSAEELADRVSLAYDRVVKGAGETRKALEQLYPELTTGDLMAYAIDPVNQLPALQRKVQAAEIGGAALAQNLSIGMQAAPTQATGFTNVQRQGMGIEELQAQGVDLARAREGFAAVADVLPTAEKLSALYGGRMAQYGRLEAEQEAFQDLASAKRARRKLTETEIAQFQGQSGRGRISKSVGGKI